MSKHSKNNIFVLIIIGVLGRVPKTIEINRVTEKNCEVRHVYKIITRGVLMTLAVTDFK